MDEVMFWWKKYPHFQFNRMRKTRKTYTFEAHIGYSCYYKFENSGCSHSASAAKFEQDL